MIANKQYTFIFFLILWSILAFWWRENVFIPTHDFEHWWSRSAVITNSKSVEHDRQSWVECSSFSLYAASVLLEKDIWSSSDIRDELWPKFSFWILPPSFQYVINKYFDASRIEKNLDWIRSAIVYDRPVIVLVEHQWYQHYFTIVWFDLDKDERYLYDSLAPREDEIYTTDLNSENPGNYSLWSKELLEKRDAWGKYWLWEMWGVALTK